MRYKKKYFDKWLILPPRLIEIEREREGNRISIAAIVSEKTVCNILFAPIRVYWNYIKYRAECEI